MSLLPIFIEPALAVAILTMPIILTNGQQMTSIQGWTIIVRQFTLAGVTIFVTITIVSSFVSDIPSHFIGIVIGISLILFPLFSFMKLQLPVTLSPKWQILAGVLAGITGGLSAEKTPLIIYCAALNLPRKTFMVAVGLYFLHRWFGNVSWAFIYPFDECNDSTCLCHCRRDGTCGVSSWGTIYGVA